MNSSRRIQSAVVCPHCHGPLVRAHKSLECPGCLGFYPVINGTPVLIDEARSVFRIAEAAAPHESGFSEHGLRRRFFAALPTLSRNVQAPRNFRALWQLVSALSPHPRVLVAGAGESLAGMRALAAGTGVRLCATDIAPGPGVAYVCDAHALPFPDGSFDGVILQAVLEHVADPYRCVEEAHRVLKAGGLVYAESPFLHPGHALPYDFHRFTYVAHRRLFRRFDEIASGMVGGPGQALANVWQAFLLSFTANRALRAALYVLARCSAFWLKYLDGWFGTKPDAISAASGLYFLGRKSARELSDRELIESFSPEARVLTDRQGTSPTAPRR